MQASESLLLPRLRVNRGVVFLESGLCQIMRYLHSANDNFVTLCVYADF